MRYQKSFEIEQRLAMLLRLLAKGEYSTPALADTLGVSIPTVSRYIAALRDRGHEIRSMKHRGGWKYVVVEKRDARLADK